MRHRLLSRLILAASLFIALPALTAAELPSASPQSQGMSAERLGRAPLHDRVRIGQGHHERLAGRAVSDQPQRKGRHLAHFRLLILECLLECGYRGREPHASERQRGAATDAANPNGSVHGIAGVCNAARNVVGLMPHPERACEARLGSDQGLVLFRSMLDACSRRGTMQAV